MKDERATEKILAQLHAAVAKDLIKKIGTGEATAQELNAAIKFLKDNGIEAEFEKGNDMDNLRTLALPEFDDEITYNG